MRQVKAKAIKHEVYGDDYSSKYRKYFYKVIKNSKGQQIRTRTIIADPKRKEYKLAKKLNRRGGQ